MPLFRLGTRDWASLTGGAYVDPNYVENQSDYMVDASGAWNSLGPWYDPLDDATGNIAHTSSSVDLGDERWVWPTTVITADGIGPTGIGISYLTSTDNVTYTSQAVSSFETRYVKTVIDADADIVYSLNSEYNQDIKTKTYQDLDTTTLSGTTAQRSIDLSSDFSAIFGVVVNSAASETDILSVQIANVEPANVAFSVVDMDSYGKVAVDGTINMTVTGYPTITLDTAAGTVTRND
jgi:hypothetical protein